MTKRLFLLHGNQITILTTIWGNLEDPTLVCLISIVWICTFFLLLLSLTLRSYQCTYLLFESELFVQDWIVNKYPFWNFITETRHKRTPLLILWRLAALSFECASLTSNSNHHLYETHFGCILCSIYLILCFESFEGTAIS